MSNSTQISILLAVALAATAFAIGFALSFVRDALRARRLRIAIERVASRSIRNPDYGKRTPKAADDNDLTQPLASDDEWLLGSGPVVLENIKITNFKNIETLEISFTKESTLVGNWTCIAGINGAGKTSILQAICLLLLGNDLCTELGRVRLGRMARRTPDGTAAAEIRGVIRQGSLRRQLYLPITGDGIDEETLRRQPDLEAMRLTWKRLREHVLVSYGVSRNVSEYKDPRYSSLSREVQRQMTLFDPLSQIASVDVLLEGGEKARPVLETLYRLLRVILSSENLSPTRVKSGDKLAFSLHGTNVDVIDLPDGFRSTVAWLGDLCDAWHASAAGRKDPSADLTAMSGIVLLDEIGLHLHASLERALVPQLRKALPNMQFVVTTHSPMVLSSFDRDELVMLDASSSTGTKELDRQVFGLSMNHVYNWLMDTKSTSKVMEELLEEGSDPNLAAYMYQSKDVNEDQARQILRERETRVKKLRRQSGET